MTDKVKQMAPLIWAEIEKSNNILLHCHKNPDADSVASALAMHNILKKEGKNAIVISGDSKKPEFLSSLPGFNDIKLASYFEIKPEEFDLFVVLDSAALDRVSDQAEIIFPEKLNTINIDHHASNTNFAKLNLVDATYPATAQLLFDLFKRWKIEISPKAAICLYTGIYTDTGGFKYPPTSGDTLRAAGDLAEIYPDFTDMISEIENSNTPDYVKFIGLALSNTNTYFGGKVAISSVSFKQLQEAGINISGISKAEISSMLRTVIGWEIDICLAEEQPNISGLSMRTRDVKKFDVGRLAIALGGGGHKAAAGASLKMTFDEAKKFLLKTIQEVYPELGQP